MEELLARLRGLIRRASGQVTPELRSGGVSLDPRLSKVTLDGAPVKLTSHEFRVLSYLMHHRGRVVSQSELTEHIYAQAFDRDSNTVEVFIARLRRKLGASFIETVRGLGYRVEAEPMKLWSSFRGTPARWARCSGRSACSSSRTCVVGARHVWLFRLSRLLHHALLDSGDLSIAMHDRRRAARPQRAVAAYCSYARRLAAVHSGRERQVDGRYPTEVQPLVNDLNALLDHRDARCGRRWRRPAISRTD